jgi:putative transposase
MDERIRFVARARGRALGAEFGISRKTGYKIFERYKDCGVAAFSDRSRRPYRQANRLPPQLEAMIVRLKREYPGWGAPKIREKLRRQSTAPHLPAISTVHAVLDRQWPRPSTPTTAPAGHRDGAVSPHAPQRAVVRRLQG